MHLDDRPAAFYRQRKLPPTDVVVPRIAPSIQAYGLAVVNHFGMMGVPTLNDATSIASSRNKMRSLQLLAASGVPVPATVMAATASDLREMVELVGGVPVLIKLLTPAERPGVMVCESLQSMEAAMEAVLSMGHNLLVQRYVHRKRERDLRALVVGDRAVAWVERRPRPGRLLHTLARGAQLKAVKVPAALDRLAVEAARVIGLEVAAVDLLEAGPEGRPRDEGQGRGVRGALHRGREGQAGAARHPQLLHLYREALREAEARAVARRRGGVSRFVYGVNPVLEALRAHPRDISR